MARSTWPSRVSIQQRPAPEQTLVRFETQARWPFAARDAVTLVLEPNRHFRGFVPGQHINVTVEIDGVRHTRSYSLTEPPRADGGRWEGRHHGYEDLSRPATHTRHIELDGAAGELRITDVVASAGLGEPRVPVPRGDGP